MTGTDLRLQMPPGPLKGDFRLPGSKSEANRWLALAAAQGDTQIQGLPDSEDVQVMLAALDQLGCLAAHTSDTAQIGFALPQAHPQAAAVTLWLEAAGTATRFLSALACFAPATVTLTGVPRLAQRPLRPLLECLRKAGARLQFAESGPVLPLRIEGQPDWQPTQFELDATASSQFVTALLLLAPRLPLGAELRLTGPPASPPYITLTLHQLRQAGFEWIESKPCHYELRAKPQASASQPWQVTGDWSAASYGLALALLRGDNRSSHPLRIGPLDPNSPQGDRQQLTIWKQLGLRTRWEHDWLCAWPEVRPCTAAGQTRPGSVPGFAIDLAAMPDLAQTFAALAAFADGPCVLAGLGTLRHKETDRVAALATELGRMGLGVEVGEDWLRITPALNFAAWADAPLLRTYGDHRMALSLSLLAASGCHIRLEAPAVVRKSFPSYWQLLESLNFSFT
jgi:3-phosphoshikimate 1-carboxyvinyltransferase